MIRTKPQVAALANLKQEISLNRDRSAIDERWLVVSKVTDRVKGAFATRSAARAARNGNEQLKVVDNK